MFKIELNSLGVAALGVMAVGAVCSFVHTVVNSRRLRKVCNNLDKAVDELAESDDIEIDISSEVVNMALERAVKREADYAVSQAVREATAAIRRDISEKVQREVNAQYNDIKSAVVREVKAQVGRLDINEIKKEVIADAKEEAMDKFRDDLDDVLDDFNDKLESISSIYSKIEKKITN